MIVVLLSLLLAPQESAFDTNWNNWIEYLEEKGEGRTIDSVVKFYVGKPYLAGSLEGDGPEELRYHLDGFDCFTLTEAAVAMCRLKEPNQKAYEKMLRLTRYREGILKGYESRLHYATEWSDQAINSGILIDATISFSGALLWHKEINYMTRHSTFYPKLQDADILEKVSQVEKKLSLRNRHYLPLSSLEINISKFQIGDIIMILTQKKGLDAAHFCYVTQMPVDLESVQQIQMVHASSTQKKVVEVDDMFGYLRNYAKILGIMVFRIKNT